MVRNDYYPQIYSSSWCYSHNISVAILFHILQMLVVFPRRCHVFVVFMMLLLLLLLGIELCIKKVLEEKMHLSVSQKACAYIHSTCLQSVRQEFT